MSSLMNGVLLSFFPLVCRLSEFREELEDRYLRGENNQKYFSWSEMFFRL